MAIRVVEFAINSWMNAFDPTVAESTLWRVDAESDPRWGVPRKMMAPSLMEDETSPYIGSCEASMYACVVLHEYAKALSFNGSRCYPYLFDNKTSH